MKRSGFTMIELIFVIVILGILASVAIPKLAATRDDAKISKALNELAMLKSDFSNYYTSHGKFDANDIKDVTNVTLYQEATCGNEVQKIENTKTYYYCTSKNNGDLESVASIHIDNTDGTFSLAATTTDQSQLGNIARNIVASDLFNKMTGDMHFGGSRVSY